MSLPGAAPRRGASVPAGPGTFWRRWAEVPVLVSAGRALLLVSVHCGPGKMQVQCMNCVYSDYLSLM